MKLNRAAVAAGLLATTVALAACSSSGGDKSGNTDGSTGGAAAGKIGGVSCATGKLNGAGSTAQTNAMDAWRKAYQNACSGTQINYDAIGSGDGISNFTDNKVDFAGSDAALKTEDEFPAANKRCNGQALNLPMVTGPVAMVYKLKGVKDLTLNASTIAQIYTGKITKWNDPAIKALNTSATLPTTKITPFYRSDDSGTTANFSSYLGAAAAKDFSKESSKVSADLDFTGQGRDGSQGIADATTQTEGGIGYVEFSFAVKAGLDTAKIDSGSGPVELSKTTAAKAVSTAKVVGKGNDLSLSIDYAQDTAGAYPLVLVTYEIVCTKYTSAATAKFVKSFLSYTVSSTGQGLLPGLGYAPLPAAIVSKVQASIAKIS